MTLTLTQSAFFISAGDKVLPKWQPPQRPPQKHFIEVITSDSNRINSCIQSTGKSYNIQVLKTCGGCGGMRGCTEIESCTTLAKV
ncbi:MAG: hypothetical protein WBQ25_03990 [Nitrososphaeraceae archaeon]